METKSQEHGNQTREIKIVVNGREKLVPKEALSFEDLVELAFGEVAGGDNILFTITYRRGHGDKPEGILMPGESVKVKDGMIFNVTRTIRS